MTTAGSAAIAATTPKRLTTLAGMKRRRPPLATSNIEIVPRSYSTTEVCSFLVKSATTHSPYSVPPNGRQFCCTGDLVTRHNCYSELPRDNPCQQKLLVRTAHPEVSAVQPIMLPAVEGTLLALEPNRSPYRAEARALPPPWRGPPTSIVEKLAHPAMAAPHLLDDHVPYRDGASLEERRSDATPNEEALPDRFELSFVDSWLLPLASLQNTGVAPQRRSRLCKEIHGL